MRRIWPCNGPFLMQGLSMPLPRLAILPTGQYPALRLAGLEVDENALVDGVRRGGMPDNPGMNQFKPFPGPTGGAGGGHASRDAGNRQATHCVQDNAFPWQKVKKDLQDKLNDRTFVLDPLLINFDPEDDKKDADPQMRNENKFDSFFQGNSPFASHIFWSRYPKPAMPLAPGAKEPKNPLANPVAVSKPYDALVRFVDPTAEAGKTYKYLVQVRMANPNFGKKDEVAFPGLAEVKELRSATVETPTITIPEEYYALRRRSEAGVQGHERLRLGHAEGRRQAGTRRHPDPSLDRRDRPEPGERQGDRRLVHRGTDLHPPRRSGRPARERRDADLELGDQELRARQVE